MVWCAVTFQYQSSVRWGAFGVIVGGAFWSILRIIFGELWFHLAAKDHFGRAEADWPCISVQILESFGNPGAVFLLTMMPARGPQTVFW